MKSLCVFFVIAISSAMAMQMRTKRQSTTDDDSNDLEDRYGWRGRPKPGRQWNQRRVQTQSPGQYPGQGQFPGQGQSPSGQWQFPSGQWQFPSGQWQFPSGQWQFPVQGQFPGQWQFPGQGRFPYLAISSAMTKQIRTKRQSTTDDDSNDLEDRYGSRGRHKPGMQWNQRLVQNQFPGQYPGQGHFSGQGQSPSGQWQFPGQGQFPGQWQFPGQDTSPSGQWQFPGQGQFPFQGQFPGQGQFPWQWQFPNQVQFPNHLKQSLISTSKDNGFTGQQTCITQCPVTAEYNPVCGTNLVQYTNPGRLACAQACGVNVSLLRSSPCPVSTTAAPT